MSLNDIVGLETLREFGQLVQVELGLSVFVDSVPQLRVLNMLFLRNNWSWLRIRVHDVHLLEEVLIFCAHFSLSFYKVFSVLFPDLGLESVTDVS